MNKYYISLLDQAQHNYFYLEWLKKILLCLDIAVTYMIWRPLVFIWFYLRCLPNIFSAGSQKCLVAYSHHPDPLVERWAGARRGVTTSLDNNRACPIPLEKGSDSHYCAGKPVSIKKKTFFFWVQIKKNHCFPWPNRIFLYFCLIIMPILPMVKVGPSGVTSWCP